MQLISQIVDKASKATADEKQARVELSNFEAECEHIHGSLTDKVAELKDVYTTLVELKLEIDAIKKEGNIIAHKNKAKVLENGTLSQERVDKFKDEIENGRNILNDTWYSLHQLALVFYVTEQRLQGIFLRNE